MRPIIYITALLVFTNLYSQDSNCLNHEYYNCHSDVWQVQDEFSVNNSKLKERSIDIVVQPDTFSEFPKWAVYRRYGMSEGFKIILKNNSGQNINLTYKNGNIIFVRQAFYQNKWQNLKSFSDRREPYCGNTKLTKTVNTGEQLNFVAPCIDGDIKVRFRFAVFIQATNEPIPVYSNEFDGFVNREIIE